MQPTKAILFDVFYTLIDLTTDEEKPAAYTFLSNWLSYKGLTIEPGEFRQLYRQLAARELASNPHQYPDIELTNVFAGILNTIDQDMHYTTDDALVNELAILFRILTTVDIKPVHETTSILGSLRKQVKLGIVSNTQRVFTLPELKKFGLAQYFDHLVFSSDVLASKPNPLIFEEALGRLGVQAAAAIFIGDNPFDDMWGAQQVGMRTLWFDRGSAFKLPEGVTQPNPDAQFRHGSSGSLYEVLVKLL